MMIVKSLAYVLAFLSLSVAVRAAEPVISETGIGWGGAGSTYQSSVTAFNQMSMRTIVGVVVDRQRPWPDGAAC